jgi:hypothetical protein
MARSIFNLQNAGAEYAGAHADYKTRLVQSNSPGKLDWNSRLTNRLINLLIAPTNVKKN